MKIGLKFVFVLSATFLLQTSFAWAWNMEDVTVKVNSFRCGSSSNTRTGSGILLRGSGKIYILTSEHVIFHSNAGYCHKFKTHSQREYRAQLVQAEWGNGLALLQTDLSPNTNMDLPGINDLALEPPDLAASAVIAGFPYRTQRILIDSSSNVVSPKSDRIRFALNDELIELNGSAEYGMSGGPVFSSDGKSVIGILSHQILTLIPGQSSATTDWSPEHRLVNRVFAIPSPVVKKWIDDVLTLNRRAVFTVPLEQKPSTKSKVALGQLIFTFEKSETTEAGIGGGDGNAGGGDGTGIGGSSENLRGSTIITLSLAPEAQKIDSPTQEQLGLSTWYDEAVARLLRREEVKIAAVVVPPHYKLIRFTSLQGFFASVAQGGLVILSTSSQFRIPGTSPSPDLEQFRKRVGAINKETASFDLCELIEELQAAVLLKIQYGSIPKPVFEKINTNPAWDELYESDFDLAVELRTYWLNTI